MTTFSYATVHLYQISSYENDRGCSVLSQKVDKVLCWIMIYDHCCHCWVWHSTTKTNLSVHCIGLNLARGHTAVARFMWISMGRFAGPKLLVF